MEFSRQEYWSGLLFPTPEDLPDQGIEPASLASPVLAGRLFSTVPPGEPDVFYLAQHPLGLSVLPQMARFQFFMAE